MNKRLNCDVMAFLLYWMSLGVAYVIILK